MDVGREPDGAGAREYLPWLGLLAVLVALALARRDRADVNAAAAADVQVAAGVAALYEQADPATAARRLARAIQLQRDHYAAHSHLAAALEKLGDRAAAAQIWTRVAELADVRRDDMMLRTARARLALLRGAGAP